MFKCERLQEREFRAVNEVEYFMTEGPVSAAIGINARKNRLQMKTRATESTISKVGLLVQKSLNQVERTQIYCQNSMNCSHLSYMYTKETL